MRIYSTTAWGPTSRKYEPHAFEPGEPNPRWCKHCGWVADAYPHASEAERRAFDERDRPAEVRTVAESVARHAAWVAAAEPDHQHTERDETYCRICGYTRHAVAHLEPGERSKAHNALYAAEELMRADHRITEPDWQFWRGIADYLNGQASRGLSGSVTRWQDFNDAVAIGYAYEHARRQS